MRLESALAALAVAVPAFAQTKIPIRAIGPVVATSTENVGLAVTVRATSDGHVIVAAAARQRVFAFDSTLRQVTIVHDSGAGTGVTAFRTTGVIPYIGDSTLLTDFGAGALIVLDGMGKEVRSMAPPHASDLTYLSVPSAFGHPALDPRGRLVYRSNLQTRTPADTAPIVRGDFDTRTVDTLGWVRTGVPEQMDIERKLDTATGAPTAVLRISLDPFARSDEWAMLNDGTIAIVRVQDYHIDWIDPDGSRRSTPKMPIDWRRYTDEERKHLADSTRQMADDQMQKMMSASGRAGMPSIKVEINMTPESRYPDFWPPVAPGSVLADRDGRVWILPTTSANSANGFTYDVVNTRGEVTERVQLPKGHVLVGFGPGHSVYMTRAEGGATYLERARLR